MSFVQSTAYYTYDIYPTYVHTYAHTYAHTLNHELTGGPNQIKNYSKHALLLCWPPDIKANSSACSMAHQCLKVYKGLYVIYIGEFFGRSMHAAFGLTGTFLSLCVSRSLSLSGLLSCCLNISLLCMCMRIYLRLCLYVYVWMKLT